MDAAEFKQQFLPYHRKLYRTAFRLTENPQEAEDMVQEAYLKLWNKRDELAGVLNTEAYCVTLVKNLCYDALRRSRPDEDGHAPEELNLPTDTNIAREVEQRDEVNQVRRLIGRLPEYQQVKGNPDRHARDEGHDPVQAGTAVEIESQKQGFVAGVHRSFRIGSR